MLSNKHTGNLDSETSNSFFFLSESFFDKKPKNINEFIGIRDTDNAQLSDDAPGMGITFIVLGILVNRRNPGSDIDGVPASVTKATSHDLLR